MPGLLLSGQMGACVAYPWVSLIGGPIETSTIFPNLMVKEGRACFNKTSDQALIGDGFGDHWSSLFLFQNELRWQIAGHATSG